jgi:uncharacterized protein (DUF1697 family)
MAELRRCLTEAGYGRVRTVLQSGNVVLDADGGADAATEHKLETELADYLRLKTTVFVRDLSQWQQLIARNPFEEEARQDPSHLLALLTRQPPIAEAVAAFASGWPGPERIAAGSGHLMVYFPEGIGRSKLTTARLEKVVGGPVTGRNWNTIIKLRDIAQT